MNDLKLIETEGKLAAALSREKWLNDNLAAAQARIAELEATLKRALLIASDENDEVFHGDLIARERAITRWKIQTRKTLGLVEE